MLGDQFGATENPNSSSTMATLMDAIGEVAIHGFGGATPADGPGGSDEVWRPAADAPKEHMEEGCGWGLSTNDQQNENQDWGSTNTTSNT